MPSNILRTLHRIAVRYVLPVVLSSMMTRDTPQPPQHAQLATRAADTAARAPDRATGSSKARPADTDKPQSKPKA